MSDFRLTQEQLALVERAAEYRRVYIKGPRCSGKTTTLLHAAMRAMTEFRVSDYQICLITSDDIDPRPIQRSLERTLALSQMRIVSIRQFTRNLHLNLGSQITWQKYREGSMSSGDETPLKRMERAIAREKELSSKTARNASGQHDRLLKIGNELLIRDFEQFTVTDMYLVAAALIWQAKSKPSLQAGLTCPYRILLVDDFETFSLAQGHLLRMLYGRGDMERLFVAETQEVGPAEGETSNLGMSSATLTHRLNRGEILDIQRQFESGSIPLVPIRGYGGSFIVQGLQDGDERRSATSVESLVRQQNRIEDSTLLQFRHFIERIVRDSHAHGRDVAVLASRLPTLIQTERPTHWDYDSHQRRQERIYPSYAARELKATFGEAYTQQSVSKRSRAIERLTHAVMTWCGLTIPNGFHLQLQPESVQKPEETTSTPLDANVRVFPAAVPETADLTVEAFQEVYDQLFEGKLIERVRACQSTSEIVALIQDAPEPALDLPEDPFQALDVLLALPYQPRLIIDQLENVSGHFSDLILVIHQQEPLPVEMLTQAFSRCLNHLHLIYLMPHPGKRVRTVTGLGSQQTSPMERIKAGEQQTRLMHQVLQDRPPAQGLKTALADALQVADLRTYLSTYAPFHVRSGLLDAWEEADDHESLALINPREPSRRWHHDVSIFHDDRQ
ncbi:hypothetical protein Dxin01_03725 [Deinococcus xinjiangensis]|uniref:DNA helicase n=1 Tax=Deinococcus xinjiangensis TaxID=457454 RepID=A0ABP9VFF4_9DEIO